MLSSFLVLEITINCLRNKNWRAAGVWIYLFIFACKTRPVVWWIRVVRGSRSGRHWRWWLPVRWVKTWLNVWKAQCSYRLYQLKLTKTLISNNNGVNQSPKANAINQIQNLLRSFHICNNYYWRCPFDIPRLLNEVIPVPSYLFYLLQAMAHTVKTRISLDGELVHVAYKPIWNCWFGSFLFSIFWVS